MKSYVYYQPNVHKCGDCAIRALTKALDKTWYTVYDLLAAEGRKQQRVMNDTEVIDAVLKAHGFEWVGLKPNKGEKRPIVLYLAERTDSKKVVLKVATHVVCAYDGHFYDTYDCGEQCVYGYWKEK